jgi:voltage-gated potassium channel
VDLAMKRFKWRILRITLAIVIVHVVGTVGYVLIDNYPVFDAFYMTIVTVTTVGYEEVHPLSRAGRVFNCVIMFFGVSLLFLAIGAMTQSIIELELGNYFEKRRTKRMIEKMKDHFIICGFGRVGRGAAEELRQAGVQFVVVDIDEDRVERAMKAGLFAVLGDCTHDNTLRDIGILRAKGVIAALQTDADNLFLTLSAKSLNPNLHLATRVSEEEAESKLRRAGADVVFAPYSTAGHQMAQSMLRPHVHEFLDFTTREMGIDVKIEQIRVSEKSEFVSKSLGQTQLRRDLGVVVLAIRKAEGNMLFNPPADEVIEGGDHLIAMGPLDKLHQLERLLTEAR